MWLPKKSDNIEVHVKELDPPDFSDAKRVWFAVKSTMEAVLARWSGWDWLNKNFGMYVRITLPHHFIRQRSVLVKPLVDGIVAAMHWQKSPDPAVVFRLADALRRPPNEISELLRMKKGSVLGEHSTFLVRGGGLQVTPRDDRCTALEIRLSTKDARFASLAFCAFELSLR